MEKHRVTVSPLRVSHNETITVKCDATQFPQTQYIITNEAGKVVRKGSINERINEFKLSMVGIAEGVYHFTMGQYQYLFTVTRQR